MNLNICHIVGRLCHSPELKTLDTGNSVANFSVATNKVWKNKEGKKQESTEFHNIVSFGKQAEVIAQWFKGGDEIYIQGSLKTSSWEDKNDGPKRYKTEIVVDKFEFGQKAKKNIEGNTEITEETKIEEEPVPVEEAKQTTIDEVPF